MEVAIVQHIRRATAETRKTWRERAATYSPGHKTYINTFKSLDTDCWDSYPIRRVLRPRLTSTKKTGTQYETNCLRSYIVILTRCCSIPMLSISMFLFLYSILFFKVYEFLHERFQTWEVSKILHRKLGSRFTQKICVHYNGRPLHASQGNYRYLFCVPYSIQNICNQEILIDIVTELCWTIEKFYFDSRRLKDTFSTQRMVWPREASIAVFTWGSFRGLKRPGREVNSFQSGSEIKNELSYTLSLSVSLSLTHTHTHTHTLTRAFMTCIRITSPHSPIYYLGKHAPSMYNESLRWDRWYLLNSWAVSDHIKKNLWTGLWIGFKWRDEGKRKDKIKRYILWRQREELPDWMTHYSGKVVKKFAHNYARKKIRRRASRYSRATD